MTGPSSPEVNSTDPPPSRQGCPADACPESPSTSATPAPVSPTRRPPEPHSQEELPQPPEPNQSQPKPGPPGGPGEGRKGSGQSQATKLLCGEDRSRCGACQHLALAFVLVLFSPIIAFGVCIADIVTGECCKVDDSEEDSEEED